MLNFNKEQLYFLISAIAGKFINFNSKKKNFKSILVIKLDEIGDMAYSLHIFEYLNSEFNNIPITVLCKPFVKPLVENIPNVKSIIHDIPYRNKFDLIIELRGNWQTLFYAIKNKPKMRLDRGTVRVFNKFTGKKLHEIYTNYEIIKPLLKNKTEFKYPKINIDIKSIEYTEKFITENNLNNYAVLHCGARKVLRQWGTANYAAILKILINKYNLQIVFAGTEEDEIVINNIIALSNADAIICTKNFSLLNFAYLTQKAKIFIGNESGPLHIAALMDTPLIGIYGPGIKDVFYPIGKKSRVLHHILDCNPCDQINCVRPQNPCINLVTVKEVGDKIDELLSIND